MKIGFKNIIIFLIDTLRADHLGCYGYPKNTSPNIDKLAKRGIMFLKCYGSDVPTQPGHTALLSATRGIKTGVVTHDPDQQTISREIFWLPRFLGENGWKTIAVSTLQSMKGWFVNGFHIYINPMAHDPGMLQQVDAEDINRYALKFIEKYRDEKFFLYIHYWDPHMYYSPPEKYSWIFYDGGDPLDPLNKSLDKYKKDIKWYFHERQLLMSSKILGENCIATDINWYISQYDGEIRYVDDSIGEILDKLDEHSLMDDTLIIITSDHGETFGRPKILFDHGDVSEPVIRLPLIFYNPVLEDSLKIESFVQSIDITPTIIDMVGLKIPQNIDGKSMLPLINKDVDEFRKRVYSNTAMWTAQRTIIEDKWKLVETIDSGFWDYPDIGLYNLEKDPFEENNVLEDEKEIAINLYNKMYRWVNSQLGLKMDPIRYTAWKGIPSLEWVRRNCIRKNVYGEWIKFAEKRIKKYGKTSVKI